MKRSKKVDLTIVTALVASLGVACSQQGAYDNNGNYVGEVKHCVDQNGIVVPDSQCNQTGLGHIPFRWYYGGSRIFSPGSRISGGSYAPSAGRTYSAPSTFRSAPSTASRGGFGTTGRASPSFSGGA